MFADEIFMLNDPKVELASELPLSQKVARKEKSCSKDEKLPKSCRATCGKP